MFRPLCQLSGCLILVQLLCQMGNFVHHTSPVTFRTDAISNLSFLYLVSISEEVKCWCSWKKILDVIYTVHPPALLYVLFVLKKTL